MITAEQIKEGIENGAIEFIEDPNAEYGTVCSIGDSWFYFGGETAEEESPEEYLKHVPIDDIVAEVADVLNEFRLQSETFGDEYTYYEHILKRARDHMNIYKGIKQKGNTTKYTVREFSAILAENLKKGNWVDYDFRLAEDENNTHDWFGVKLVDLGFNSLCTVLVSNHYNGGCSSISDIWDDGWEIENILLMLAETLSSLNEDVNPETNLIIKKHTSKGD